MTHPQAPPHLPLSLDTRQPVSWVPRPTPPADPPRSGLPTSDVPQDVPSTTCRRPSWFPRPGELRVQPCSLGCERPAWGTPGQPRSATSVPSARRVLRAPLASAASVATYQATWDLAPCCFLKPDHTRLCLSLWNPARRAGRRRRCPETVNRARLNGPRARGRVPCQHGPHPALTEAPALTPELVGTSGGC